MPSPTSILLVEDDESLGYMLSDILKNKGWQIFLAADGAKGLTTFLNNKIDLCILDIMLPLQDGFTLAQKIRNSNGQVPLLFLTAKNQPEDRIKGFKLGADDYISKPFNVEELTYRVEAILKRTYNNDRINNVINEFKISKSKLNIANQCLTINNAEQTLTYKETQLVKIFFENPNRLIPREVFLKRVWQDDGFFVARSMDVFISRLRKYLKPDTSIYITNVRGMGYKMIIRE